MQEDIDRAAVIRVLTDYYSAFSKLDAQAILPFFHEPCLMVGPLGVAALPNQAALLAMMTPAMEALRAKEFARSALTALQVDRLSAATAMAGGTAVRYKTNGQELERVGVSYLLQKSGNGWKIAVLVVHDAR